MKTRNIVLPLMLLMAAVSSAPALAQSGGGITITWSTLDGGGGRSLTKV